MLTDKDIQLIEKKGITATKVYEQMARLKDGMMYSNLVAAATLGKGIDSYDKNKAQHLIKFYESKMDSLSLIKFVPASGAASRMFKFLFQFLKNFNPSKESIQQYAERKNDVHIETFFNNLERFPFYHLVINEAKRINPRFDALPENEKYMEFVKAMLSKNGLNYSFLPKGLLPFHKYNDTIVTAFYEHLFESTLYSSSKKMANLHFTVSENHHDYFINELHKIKDTLEKETKTTFKVSFSYQKEATSTIALTAKEDIFRNDDGSILFRPAGHGALLENLNDLDYDLIFIKNVDNIVVSNKNKNISNYKKLLAGVLLEAQQITFSYLHQLDQGRLKDADFIEMALFLKQKLNVPIDDDFDSRSSEEKTAYLRLKLNKPIRVCGMVKNEGEPGGGPFWVKDKNHEVSLQIVEFAQINFSRKNQQSLVYKATHFNPTDLVCGVRNYKGEKFNLMDYADPEAAFITMKAQNGVEMKALELPGLWNGSMAHWNSIFVEVPLKTFNPVKTVNDLLKPAHQVS